MKTLKFHPPKRPITPEEAITILNWLDLPLKERRREYPGLGVRGKASDKFDDDMIEYFNELTGFSSSIPCFSVRNWLNKDNFPYNSHNRSDATKIVSRIARRVLKLNGYL